MSMKRDACSHRCNALQRCEMNYPLTLNQRVPGSSPGAPTTHSLRLCSLQGTRNTAAVSKTCAPSSLTCAVSAHELAANSPIFARRLRGENSRSRLRFRDGFDDCVVGITIFLAKA